MPAGMMQVDSKSYEELLCDPPADLKADPQAQVARATIEYADKGERFRVRKRLFDKQYADTYFSRLAALRPRAMAAAEEAWPGVPVRRILELHEGQDCVLLGTLYKEQRLKPSVLDEYTKAGKGGGSSAAQLTGAARFASEDDSLVLEDDGGRIRLQPAPEVAATDQEQVLPVGRLVSGVVAAVRGRPDGSDFHVMGVVYAQPRDPAPLPPPREEGGGDDDRYVALACGLCVGEDATNPLRVSLLVDYLTGMLGNPAEQRGLAGRVVRLVVAGGVVQGGGGGPGALASAPVVSSGKQQAAAVAPLREADMVLTQLASLLPVDVMPGPADPANYSLPQQPMHSCLFPGASRFNTFRQVTNPHELRLGGAAAAAAAGEGAGAGVEEREGGGGGGITLLGTSGQNVDDIYRYSTHANRLDVMESCLRWGHLVPTAPDTLTAYPFSDQDPFVMEIAPHVLFAGGQPEFASRLVERQGGAPTLLLALPLFATSGIIALVNLRTLQCQPIQFDVTLQ